MFKPLIANTLKNNGNMYSMIMVDFGKTNDLINSSPGVSKENCVIFNRQPVEILINKNTSKNFVHKYFCILFDKNSQWLAITTTNGKREKKKE
jgi:UDP-N-acetylmuramoylalanine-D-glutamate ligase